jgi:hypothetical protein
MRGLLLADTVSAARFFDVKPHFLLGRVRLARKRLRRLRGLLQHVGEIRDGKFFRARDEVLEFKLRVFLECGGDGMCSTVTSRRMVSTALSPHVFLMYSNARQPSML